MAKQAKPSQMSGGSKQPGGRHASTKDEPAVMGGHIPPMPSRDDLFGIALNGANTAMPVLITMLKTAGLKRGLMVADEIWGNVKCALKVHNERQQTSPGITKEGSGLSSEVRRAPTEDQ